MLVDTTLESLTMPTTHKFPSQADRQKVSEATKMVDAAATMVKAAPASAAVAPDAAEKTAPLKEDDVKPTNMPPTTTKVSMSIERDSESHCKKQNQNLTKTEKSFFTFV